MGAEMIYVASPYSHPKHIVREARYLDVRDFVAFLMKNQLHPYSPILHTHDLAVAHELPTDALYWQVHNHKFIQACSQVYVLCIDGVEASKGVKEEVQFAMEIGKPVVYWAPDQHTNGYSVVASLVFNPEPEPVHG